MTEMVELTEMNEMNEKAEEVVGCVAAEEEGGLGIAGRTAEQLEMKRKLALQPEVSCDKGKTKELEDAEAETDRFQSAELIAAASCSTGSAGSASACASASTAQTQVRRLKAHRKDVQVPLNGPCQVCFEAISLFLPNQKQRLFLWLMIADEEEARQIL